MSTREMFKASVTIVGAGLTTFFLVDSYRHWERIQELRDKRRKRKADDISEILIAQRAIMHRLGIKLPDIDPSSKK